MTTFQPVEAQTANNNGNGNGNVSNGTSTSITTNGNGSAIKSLVEHVDQIKDTLRNVIRDLAGLVDTVKQAEREKRVAEKEIEAIRAKLRQIKSVNI